MTVKTNYSPGEPIWVDLGTPDLDKTVAFYTSLFGWTYGGGDEAFGGYGMFFSGGRQVAGVMPLMEENMPPVWTSYVCTDDADKTTALVGEAGGIVIAAPMDVGDLGRMALYTDPAGAFFGVWQPGTHIGAELTDDEGTLTWIETSTRDQAAARPFYATVFGWGANVQEGYTEFQLSGTSVAGCMDMPDMVPTEVPSYWMPYFAASEPAAKAEQVASLGGTVVVPFQEFPGGTFSVVMDPHGSTFGLLNLLQS
jgi:predicted enzyme related to lactoylglutathione lyase